MTLDDVYGSDLDRFPLEQETAAWDEGDLDLGWDDEDVRRIERQFATDPFNLH